MTKPNILFLSDLYPNPAWPAYGIFVERQATHLKKYCDIVVVSPVRIFPHLRLVKAVAKPKQLKKIWLNGVDEIKRIPEADIIHDIPVYYPRYTSLPRQIFHATWGFGAYLFLYRMLKDLQKRHHFNLVHAHYATPAGVIALLAKRWMKIPIILSVHGSDITYTARQNPFSAFIIRQTFQRVDKIVANSTWTANHIINLGVHSEKIEIIRYGGDLPIDSESIETPVKIRESINLLSVGYLEERKGQAFVLKAIKQLSDQGYNIRYVMVGNGSQQSTLEKLTEELGIKDIVSFAGYKSHSEVRPYFSNCDIFVLPSWDEAFGIVYVEALGLGKPVIGCEGEGGPQDIKSLGDCIELVKARDVISLVSAISCLIDNPDKRMKMGKIGREIVHEYFTWDSNAYHTNTIYNDLLNKANE